MNFESSNPISGFTVKLICACDLSPEEQDKIKEAVMIMAMELGSEEFKQFCLNFSYSATYRVSPWWKVWDRQYKTFTYRQFNWNNGKSRERIYKQIMSGAEVLSPVADSTANITLVIDNRNKRGVLGYTYPNSVKQWIYRWFLKSSPRDIAGNLAHEWMHKLGYDHAFRYHYTRQFTVPYAVGYYISKGEK